MAEVPYRWTVIASCIVAVLALAIISNIYSARLDSFGLFRKHGFPCIFWERGMPENPQYPWIMQIPNSWAFADNSKTVYFSTLGLSINALFWILCLVFITRHACTLSPLISWCQFSMIDILLAPVFLGLMLMCAYSQAPVQTAFGIAACLLLFGILIRNFWLSMLV